MSPIIRVLLAAFLAPAYAAPAVKQALPAEFRHDRIFVSPKTPAGPALEFYTDTGGGWNAVRASDAARLGLKADGVVAVDGAEHPLVDFPAFDPKAGIPPPSPDPWLKGRLVAVPDKALDQGGFLGSRWFGGKVWEFDYLRKSLSVLTGWKPPAGTKNAAKLGFRLGRDGVRDLQFPRVTILVDGAPLEMLFDTGATALLTAASGKEYGLPAGTQVGASYVTKSVFERWAKDHPDWKVVPDAEAVTGNAFPMIRVPQVSIAGLAVGPVWFTQRPDDTFRTWMSQMMDKPIEGAVGGSALRYFRVVVDYPNAVAYFWR